MKYRFNYGSDVITLPKSAAENLGSVSRESLAVLISLAADKGMSAKKRAASLGISIQALESAVRYWNALGVISAEDIAESARTAASAETSSDALPGATAAPDVSGSTADRKAAAVLDNSTPHLTLGELASHAVTKSTSGLLEYCQQMMGRMLNSAEAERIVGICDYLGVSSDFVALLCKNLKEENRLTLRALENLALELHDRGITEYEALTEHIDHREKARSFEGKVRKLFGLGNRALTPAERKMLEKWAALGTSGEMIDFAYELTVSTTGNASLKYSNAIIESWAADGVTNVEEAKKREEEFRQKSSKKPSARPERTKKAGEQTHSSFDTNDDFFEKALRRSFGNDFYDNVWNGEQADSGDGDKK